MTAYHCSRNDGWYSLLGRRPSQREWCKGRPLPGWWLTTVTSATADSCCGQDNGPVLPPGQRPAAGTTDSQRCRRGDSRPTAAPTATGATATHHRCTMVDRRCSRGGGRPPLPGQRPTAAAAGQQTALTAGTTAGWDDNHPLPMEILSPDAAARATDVRWPQDEGCQPPPSG